MNKKELIKAIHTTLQQSKETANLSQKAVTDVMEAFEEEIIRTVTSNEQIKLVGLFTIIVKQRAERMIRNPKTGMKSKIGPTKVVQIKVGDILKKAANGLTK